MKMNRHAYESLTDDNIKWLEEQEHSLERDHIKVIVENSVDFNYPPEDDNIKNRVIKPLIELVGLQVATKGILVKY